MIVERSMPIVVLSAILSLACLSSCRHADVGEDTRKTSMSMELDSSRVQLLDHSIFFDKRKVDSLSLHEATEKLGHQPPKILPDGTKGYCVTDLQNSLLFLSGGYKPTAADQLAQPTPNTYLWNKSTKQTKGPRMFHPRVQHTVVRISDRRYAIAGGITDVRNVRYAKPIEVYDVANNSISPAGQLHVARIFPGTLVINGSILFAGGQVDSEESNAETSLVELYDPESGSSRILGNLCYPRQSPGLYRAGEAQVLVVDGYNSLSEKNSSSLPPELLSLP